MVSRLGVLTYVVTDSLYNMDRYKFSKRYNKEVYNDKNMNIKEDEFKKFKQLLQDKKQKNRLSNNIVGYMKIDSLRDKKLQYKNSMKLYKESLKIFFESLMVTSMVRREPELFYSLTHEEAKFISTSNNFRHKIYKSMTNMFEKLNVMKPSSSKVNITSVLDKDLKEEMEKKELISKFFDRRKIVNSVRKFLR